MPSLVMQANLPGLTPHRGKVRDTYDLGKVLLMVTTDRISAFDVVLPTGIPEKGIVLGDLSAFWFRQTAHLIPNHLIRMAYEPATNDPFPIKLPDMPADVRRRAAVVRKAERIDVECVARGYITGSAWAEYRKSGAVNGQKMPAGMKESQAFPEPIFTPTTKAEQGHDMPVTQKELEKMVGADLTRQLRDRTLEVYSWALDFAKGRGIILADTKFEFGWIDGKLHIIDEMLTPDSSRFWDAAAYKPGASQPSLDKQYVRDWLTDSGWNKEPPAPALPEDVVRQTAEKYKDAYRRLTGKTLETR